MIVGWEVLLMKKNYDDEQENTTAYRVRLLRQDRGWSQKESTVYKGLHRVGI